MIEIYDTTLRDGTQREGISLTCDDKLRIAARLDELGIPLIEGGWPGSNPKDVEFFARARDRPWQQSAIVAFGATRRVGVAIEDDANLRAVLDAGTDVCTIFGKSWSLHVTEVLRTSLDDNLELIEESIAYLKAAGRRVIYDAEHFFDGYAADPEYAVATLSAAVRGGAEVVVLCDTNGGSMPWQVEAAVGRVSQAIDCRLGIHTHDDSGCAVANAIAAINAGVVHVQGTVNGYGERCGNANLCTIIANLELKLGMPCLPDGALARLYDVSRFVAETANLAPDEHMPYVGRSAFAHKGGVHVSAIRRNSRSYNHVVPSLVGNEMRVVVSELSGRGNVLCKAEELGFRIDKGWNGGREVDVGSVLAEIKQNEASGFAYESAEASIALMLARRQAEYQPPYQLIDYMVNVEHRQGRGTFAEATVKVAVHSHVVHTAAEGNGPVHALDRALRKALLPVYPGLAEIELLDYKVRILDGSRATSSTTRVLMLTTDSHSTWGTVGASTNIIDASWRALTDAFEYGLCLLRRAQTTRAMTKEPTATIS